MNFRDSRQASVVSVIAVGLPFALLRLGYINARTDAFGLTITLALYITGLVLAVTSWASLRLKSILAIGIVMLGALYMALDRIDAVYMAYLLRKNE